MTLDGWQDLPLSELATIIGGGTPSRSQPAYWNGDVPWATPTDVTGLKGRVISETNSTITDEGLANSSSVLLPPHSLLMTTRATIGACAVNQVSMATNQGFQSLVPKEGARVEFLYYLIQHHKRRLERLAAGSTFLEVSKRTIRDFRVVVPPLPEQRKIAAILSSVDDVIEKTQSVIDQVQVVKRGLMQELLTRGLPGRHAHIQAAHDREETGRDEPDGWRPAHLGDLARVNPEQLGSRTDPDHLLEYLDIAAIEQPGVIGASRTFRFSEAPSRARRLAREGDILVSTVRPYLRNFARVREAPDNLVVSTGYAVIRPGGGVDGGFLYQHVLSARFVDFLKPRMSGSNYPAVTADDVEAYPLFLPPLSEQREIAAVLSSVDDAMEESQTFMDRLRVVKSGLMSILLTGELRVTPDPEAV